ncbi:MAG: hypothetical protein A2808_01925 [Candidatus Moranbacteria bacterium RIFCSPHIGHO2_01_FULL_55_24]|nr:MAG: hypothetical protein A2808_01925 [Candidatus Moranbacteria bacterium RIFCSPHIGHO2_01_FULL_55_24]
MKSQKALRGAVSAIFFVSLMFALRQIAYASGWETVCNVGSAFGIPVAAPILIILNVLFLAMLLYWFFREYSWGALLMLAGGMSNLWERIRYGCVSDYFFLPFWPAFNLADCFLVFGGCLIAWQLFRKKKA